MSQYKPYIFIIRHIRSNYNYLCGYTFFTYIMGFDCSFRNLSNSLFITRTLRPTLIFPLKRLFFIILSAEDNPIFKYSATSALVRYSVFIYYASLKRIHISPSLLSPINILIIYNKTNGSLQDCSIGISPSRRSARTVPDACIHAF